MQPTSEAPLYIYTVVRLTSQKQYFNQVIFDAQFITLVASYSGANAKKYIHSS